MWLHGRWFKPLHHVWEWKTISKCLLGDLRARVSPYLEMSKSALVAHQRHVDRRHHGAQAAMFDIFTCEGDALLLLGPHQSHSEAPPLSLFQSGDGPVGSLKCDSTRLWPGISSAHTLSKASPHTHTPAFTDCFFSVFLRGIQSYRTKPKQQLCCICHMSPSVGVLSFFTFSCGSYTCLRRAS